MFEASALRARQAVADALQIDAVGKREVFRLGKNEMIQKRDADGFERVHHRPRGSQIARGRHGAPARMIVRENDRSRFRLDCFGDNFGCSHGSGIARPG